MEFHVHLSKRIPENFGTGRQVSAVLNYTVVCKAFQISDCVTDAEGKGFVVADIHTSSSACPFRNPETNDE